MKLRTIGLISTLVLGLLAGALTAEAQKATKIPPKPSKKFTRFRRGFSALS